jgi:trehalose 6-phosphate phosphatase
MGDDDAGSERAIEQALAALAPVWSTPRDAALLFDFDGTLAPIVPDPPSARPVPSALPRLRDLAERFGTVAIVSGRPLAFLMQVMPDLDDVTLVGHYGLQRLSGGEIIIDPRVEPYRHAVDEIAALAEDLLPGVFIERKSGISVTVHWRQTPSSGQRCLEVAEKLATRFGFAVLPGRMSAEIHPPIDLDKGKITAELTSTSACAACFGDDVGDLSAFKTLHDLAASHELRAAVAVAVASPESPRELLEAATALLPDPFAVSSLLARVLQQVAGRTET